MYNSDEVKDYIMNFKFPKFVSINTKLWFSVLRYVMLTGFLINFIFIGISTQSNSMELWYTIKTIFFIVFFIAVYMGINNVVKNLVIRKQCKKLGIDVKEWNTIVQLYEIEVK